MTNSQYYETMFQWHVQGNAFENVVCQMAIILFMHQCAKCTSLQIWSSFLTIGNIFPPETISDNQDKSKMNSVLYIHTHINIYMCVCIYIGFDASPNDLKFDRLKNIILKYITTLFIKNVSGGCTEICSRRSCRHGWGMVSCRAATSHCLNQGHRAVVS